MTITELEKYLSEKELLSVKVSGSVNTAKAGIYRLVYSVTNSKGITTVETRVITVE